jgi:hypothetical protein
VAAFRAAAFRAGAFRAAVFPATLFLGDGMGSSFVLDRGRLLRRGWHYSTLGGVAALSFASGDRC